MLSLSMTRDSLKNSEEWSERNILLPRYDIDEVRKNTSFKSTKICNSFIKEIYGKIIADKKHR